MFKWFATAQSKSFGKELAGFVMGELSASVHKRDAKFAAKAEKVLARAEAQVQQFKAREPMNFYKKAKVANAFLWALRDGGCPQAYADQLTDWLTQRL